jgi:hypothetical protein
MVAATGGRLSLTEAERLTPIERRAILYGAALLNGKSVDWDTGYVKDRPPPAPPR